MIVRSPGTRGSIAGRRRGMPFLACACVVMLAFAYMAPRQSAGEDQTAAGMPDLTSGRKSFPNPLNAYRSTKLPGPDLTNSAAVSQLARDGKLELSVSQLVDAVMHNNLDIEVARYYGYYSQTDILRAKSGAAPRGSAAVSIPSGLFAGALGAGLGSTVAGVGNAQTPSVNSSGRAVNVNPRGGFDGAISFNVSIDQTSTPLNSIAISGVRNSLTHTTAFQSRYAQAFPSGTTFSITFNALRQSTTQNVIFSPAYVPAGNIAFTQQLLNGFGFATNRRFLTVATTGREIAREAFRQQVFTTLAQAQNSYWDLVSFQETVRAAEQALKVSQQLYENNKKSAEVGTLAPLDVTAAEAEVAGRTRDLIIAQTNLRKAEVQLKTVFSKNLDSSLADAQIVPTDTLPDPNDADIPTLENALADAQRNRPELRQAEGNIVNSEVAVKFSRDALKPVLSIFGQLSSTSLYGTRTIAGVVVPGGLGTAFSQFTHFDYPGYAFGLSLNIPIRNRSAQADNLRARLDQRQGETALQRTRNQIALEVRNALTGIMQAKAQVEAARTAVQFETRTFEAEQKRVAVGTSTPYNLILVQRDMLNAQLAEVRARATYAKARVEVQRATGTLLEKNHVDPQDVPPGQIPRT